ncbi:MAG: Fe3+/spermidine/putrescine ABC transporter ATP-binding protein [Acidiferrobacteraceae bacterium]|nr:Fe3+/spermidine/putrescine ABC transporter ATP-binding protein [Acidiferrobacteraceae bacterium]
MDHIKILSVSKCFGEVIAVNDVSINIKKGEFFSLLGPSGCGKTTLLRLLAGFEMPDKGEIIIDGIEMNGVPPHQRPTNMVFQSYAIFPHLDVTANVAYGLRKSGLSKAQITQRVTEALELVKLSGYEARKSNELSGGQRQRVALARALIMRPKVLLLDEPLGALDKKLREEMQIELRTLQEQIGITFVFVTHDQEEALTMSDRMAVMGDGIIQQVGTPREIYEQPVSRTVATFIGNINLLEGIVLSRSSAALSVELPIFGKVEIRNSGPGRAVGETVSCVIRPENLSIGASPTDSSIGVILQRSAYFGKSTYFIVRAEDSSIEITVSMQNSRVAPQAGSHLWISWDSSDLVILDE